MQFSRKLSDKQHHQVYFASLLLLAISLPTSKGLMSIFPFVSLANWIWEGRFKQKVQILRTTPSISLLISVFFVYLVGLSWTSSMFWGLHDLKIQVPLLLMPLIIGTSQRLNFREVKILIAVLSAAVIFASICSMYVWLGFSGKEIQNSREISLFISHIRFALLINISIFSLGWYVFNPKLQTPSSEKKLFSAAIIWLTLFLFILKSLTGLVIFFITTGTILAWLGFNTTNRLRRMAITLSVILILILPIAYIGWCIQKFYAIEPITSSLLNEKTSLGNPYSHDLKNRQLENGHYIFLFINENELREEWSNRSNTDYESSVPSGYNKYVLFRYLTSKGLRKDADGLKKLTDQDIRNIEHGIPNYLFAEKLPVYNRIYQLIWEFDVYQKGGNPSGHSFTQRIEYYKIAWQIIREHFWVGTGTGGYFKAYQEKYDQNPYFKDEQFRQRSHNMFLCYWVDYGLIGLGFICFAFTYPVFREKKQKSFLLLIFLFIVLLSCLNEDTLANHDGITFFATLYAVFLFADYEQSDQLSTDDKPAY